MAVVIGGRKLPSCRIEMGGIGISIYSRNFNLPQSPRRVDRFHTSWKACSSLAARTTSILGYRCSRFSITCIPFKRLSVSRLNRQQLHVGGFLSARSNPFTRSWAVLAPGTPCLSDDHIPLVAYRLKNIFRLFIGHLFVVGSDINLVRTTGQFVAIIGCRKSSLCSSLQR